MKNLMLAALILGGLAACQTTAAGGGPATASRAAVDDANTPSELLAMGARQLSASDFRSELIGRTLDEGRWTWIINADGTASSGADDGSWMSTSTWDFSGDRYCRQAENFPRKCSSVYEIGGIYRFSDAADTLEDWSVSVQ